VAVLFVDLDNFKTVNDTYGHDMGDQVLRIIATRLRAGVRGSDTVSRLGGDEFVVLLSEVNEKTDAGRVAAKLVREAAEPCQINDQRIQVTVSIGIAVFPDDGRSAEGLIKSADEAMYRAKMAGRNAYRFFATPDHETA